MSDIKSNTDTNNDLTTKKTKSKGIVRWEAIIPFTAICVGFGAYMHFFLDSHLKSALEYGGYQALGAEVNVNAVKSSFWNAQISISGIQFTNSEKPTHNSLEVGDIRFGMSWDALLRAKILINEMAVEGLRYDTARKSPGKVKPPTPPQKGPSMAEKMSQEALGMIERKNEDNLMGDLAAILGGGDANAQLDKLQGQLASKEMLNRFEADLKAKQTEWENRFNSLPSNKDIEALSQRLQKIKTKDFKTPQELQASLTELDSILKEADSKYKQVTTAGSDLNKDFSSVDQELKKIETQIKEDIKDLQAHFRIPSLDVGALAKSLFMAQLSPYLSKVAHYRGLAYEYLPPKFTKAKGDQTDEDENLQPHPRAKGISYEFGKPNSYPLLWIKRTGISSQAGQGGLIKGEILDITTHQRLTGRPTVLNVEGDFPDNNIRGLKLAGSFDNRPSDSIIKTSFQIAEYAYSEKTLADSKDFSLKMIPKSASVDLKASLIGLKNLNLELINNFNKVEFIPDSQNSVAKEILQSIFATINSADIKANVEGTIPKVNISLSSNVGPAIAKGLEQQVNKKIEEAKQKLQAYIDAEVGNKKKEIEQQINKAKAQFEGELSKVKAAIEGQKKSIDDKVKAAKADTENKAKSSLEKEAKKAAEDLKKKLGF